MTEPLTLETPRLAPRDLDDADGPAVHEYSRDDTVVRYLDWGPNTLEETTQFLAVARAARTAVPRTDYHLGIVLRTTRRLLGGCRIHIRDLAAGDGDIGYVLARGAWGQGLATEAARALVDFGFDRLALHRIWATCDVENQASARVLEKLGMRREGHLRQSVRRKGEWRDSYLYAILEPDWRTARDSRDAGAGPRGA